MILSNSAFCGIRDFNTSKSIVNIRDFSSGGPGKDGIPSITDPEFVPASKAHFLKRYDLVIGLYRGGKAKAYPLGILNWHEIINDTIAGKPVAVTWCPLTRSAIVFDRRIKGKTLDFGVSGLLYNSNLVMYDRASNGLWPQIESGAVTGRYSSSGLKVEPSLVTTWHEWKRKYPETLVLSKNTGYRRDYGRDPYDSYHKSSRTMFPLKHRDNRLEPKSLVIGIKINNISKAYPLEVIKRKNEPVRDTLDDTEIEIYADSEGSAHITDKYGNLLPAVTMYWFAWSAFNQDTLIFQK